MSDRAAAFDLAKTEAPIIDEVMWTENWILTRYSTPNTDWSTLLLGRH